jgi:hypothetical protein
LLHELRHEVWVCHIHQLDRLVDPGPVTVADWGPFASAEDAGTTIAAATRTAKMALVRARRAFCNWQPLRKPARDLAL